jgi:hypothetical protein
MPISEAMASATSPFKTLRVVTEPNGTIFVGGSSLTITHTSTGHYHIAFPVGTWNNSGSACFFLPQVQSMFTTSPAEITGYGTTGDGAGAIDVAILSGADAWLVMVFTSANC